MTDSLFDLDDVPGPAFSHGATWTVRETTPQTARSWVTRWHYSRRMPGGGTRSWAVYGPDLVAVVMVSLPNNKHGVAGRLGLAGWPGNLEISRVVAHPDAPRNTASRAVAAVCDRYARGVVMADGALPSRFDWLFSYADTGQGHHGGIYQALNAVYVGLSETRPGFRCEGVPVHPRSLVSTYGTQAWPRIRDLYLADTGKVLERVMDMNTAKHTYVLPIGGPASRRAIRRALAPITRPYPKREGQT